MASIVFVFVRIKKVSSWICSLGYLSTSAFFQQLENIPTMKTFELQKSKIYWQSKKKRTRFLLNMYLSFIDNRDSNQHFLCSLVNKLFFLLIWIWFEYIGICQEIFQHMPKIFQDMTKRCWQIPKKMPAYAKNMHVFLANAAIFLAYAGILFEILQHMWHIPAYF